METLEFYLEKLDKKDREKLLKLAKLLYEQKNTKSLEKK